MNNGSTISGASAPLLWSGAAATLVYASFSGESLPMEAVVPAIATVITPFLAVGRAVLDKLVSKIEGAEVEDEAEVELEDETEGEPNG